MGEALCVTCKNIVSLEAVYCVFCGHSPDESNHSPRAREVFEPGIESPIARRIREERTGNADLSRSFMQGAVEAASHKVTPKDVEAFKRAYGMSEVGAWVPAENVVKLQSQLAVSEKERERLKGELDEARRFVSDNSEHLQAVHWKDQADTLRRKLENHRMHDSMKNRDLNISLQVEKANVRDLGIQVAFLKRELDRERAKGKKRGI